MIGIDVGDEVQTMAGLSRSSLMCVGSGRVGCSRQRRRGLVMEALFSKRTTLMDMSGWSGPFEVGFASPRAGERVFGPSMCGPLVVESEPGFTHGAFSLEVVGLRALVFIRNILLRLGLAGPSGSSTPSLGCGLGLPPRVGSSWLHRRSDARTGQEDPRFPPSDTGCDTAIEERFRCSGEARALPALLEVGLDREHEGSRTTRGGAGSTIAKSFSPRKSARLAGRGDDRVLERAIMRKALQREGTTIGAFSDPVNR